MKTVALLSRKGGSGKTTLSLHLAVAAQRAGLKVGVVDLDPQQSAAVWSDDRAGGPEVISAQHVRLPKVLEAARDGGADVIFIDTPASNTDVPQYAAQHADIVLIPTRASKSDVVSNFASHATAESHNKPAFIVFNDEPHRRAGVIDSLTLVLKDRRIAWAPVVIKTRVIYDESISQGSTAQEMEPDGKAAAEIDALFQWLCRELDLSTKLVNEETMKPPSDHTNERVEV